MLSDYLPVFLMAGVVTLLGLFILKISSLLRPANPYPAKNQPYECGVDPVGDASVGQVKIHYFVIAIAFIIFDVETLYLFPWAVVLTDIGLFGYIEMFVFIFLLLVGFIYAWATGALEWQI
ncbi:NADH-quinone oxidoreductase subunit A [Aromatoleum toluclasticum]|uniref:NADH-quinone oxidoreductase subunit A n=1 Tax=Aromatoleum toluclasticum TaxID=92003 RepID=UPI001D194E37|nr:NADH-quinone oxidoreductase subunit A [Aromatoleum toluclasticum]MCC4118080.1 NADH-quinone oxidoreductase subunit A [Aromatoleum toluclasticum]